MTDEKRESLAQALYFHNSLFGTYSTPKGIRPTAEQIVATAKKFETFLAPHKGK